MSDAERGPLPDALYRLLGLPGSASNAAVEGAYWRLRGRIEERIEGGGDPTFLAERRRELTQLHAALAEALGSEAAHIPAPGAEAPAGRSRRPVLIALAATVVLLLVAFLLWPRTDEQPLEPAVAPTDAQLVVRADPPTATLNVTTGEDQRVVSSGPADGSPRALPAGDYSLAVFHPDCPDDWSQAVSLARGESRAYAPRICQGEGRVVVRSNVAEDRLRIDGVDVGSTGAEPYRLRVGRHRVQVDKEGYAPWTAEIKIEPDGEVTLSAELSAAGAAGARPAGQSAEPPAAAPAPAPVAAAAGERRAAGYVNADAGGRARPARTGKGGSKSWHDAIKADLISQFDRNGSRSLDTIEEVQSIPCETWQNIERSYETGGLAVEMTHLYGFDGSDAPANTLGVAPGVRGYAYDRMKECGLKARR